jgi:hypothetical protein
MKASKYYLVFEQQMGHWERTLALASETVEMILQVGQGELCLGVSQDWLGRAQALWVAGRPMRGY